MSTANYLEGEYETVHEALKNARHTDGDSLFYAVNYDIYIRTRPTEDRVWHLVYKKPVHVLDGGPCTDGYFTWQEMSRSR